MPNPAPSCCGRHGPTEFPWGGPPIGKSSTDSAWGQHLLPAPLSPGCSPRKCGRGISDTVITRDEAQRIRRYPSLFCPEQMGKWGCRTGSRQFLLKKQCKEIHLEFRKHFLRASKGKSRLLQFPGAKGVPLRAAAAAGTRRGPSPLQGRWV